MDTYEWLTILAIALGASWPVYQLYQHTLGSAVLNLRLTRNLFFRYSDYGECIFLKPVMIAEGGNALITGVKAKLRRTDKDVQKEWDIEFLHFGELVRKGDSVTLDHCYHSTSPLDFLPKNMPQRAVYFGRVKHYAGDVQALIDEFNSRVTKLGETQQRFPTPGAGVPNDKLYQDLAEIASDISSRIGDAMQLEHGHYEVGLTVEYSSLSGVRKQRKSVQSKVRFRVEERIREAIKQGIPLALYRAGINYLSNTDAPLSYPEYQPVDIEEVK